MNSQPSIVAGDGRISAPPLHTPQMTIAYNDDLLTAIFIWLPLKSLIKFKLVCKHWFSLISSDYFFHQHTLHHRPETEPSLLLGLSGKPAHFYYLHFNRHAKNLLPYHFSPPLIEPTILSYSKGLFLLQCAKIENPLKECYIYNPTTKQTRKIILNANRRYTSIVGLTLAFDPLKSPHYKIICVRSARRSPASFLRLCGLFSCHIEVYESETGAWELRGEPFSASMDVGFNHGIYVNCCVHWRGQFFNLEDGFVREHPEILVPNDIAREKSCRDYAESCGCLHCIAHFPERDCVLVFELGRDCSEWSLKFRVDLNRISRVMFSVLGVVEENAVLVIHEPGKVMMYEFEEMKMEELVDFRDKAFYRKGRIQFVPTCSFRFVETLARV